jgi:ATP-dependent DNA helicase RecG
VNFNPYPKNPNIRKFFTAFGWTDEIGSGIRNTWKYLPLYVQDARPVFTENDTFSITIPIVFTTLENFAEELRRWLGLDESVQAHFRKSSAKIAIPSWLDGSPWEEFLLHLVPSWSEKGTQLPSLDWPQNQPLTVETIKKVPSWDEKGTQLLSKKIWYYITILLLCGEPVRTRELLAWIGYRNEKTFRDRYIKPLREAELITLTFPEQPTNPENRYVLTEKGKSFLGGK